MEKSSYESYPTIGKGKSTAVNYHQVAAYGDDNGLTTQHNAGHTFEKPKTVLKRGLSFSKFFIHILALLTTAAVAGLNFANVYGWDQGTTMFSDNQANNLLQFAAKLHEIIVVGSLTSIVMQRIRERLISSKGLPFGLLSSGYQISSLEYLFSKGFWSAFTTDGGLVLALAATIIYVTVVGPSSAIVVIPRLDWWDVRAPFKNPPHSYLASSLDHLYPTRMGPPNMTLYEGCDTIEYTSGCPGAGFRALRDWAASLTHNGVPPNISMTEAMTNTERALLIETFIMWTSHSLTTTLAQPILELTGLFWNYIQEDSTGEISKFQKPMLVTVDTAPVYAPVVKVECTSFNYSEAIKGPGPDNPAVSFPTTVLDNNTISAAWPVDPLLWNFTRPMNATNFTWVDVSSYSDGNGTGASLGALVTLPTLGLDNATMNDTFWDLSQQSRLMPCLIKAKWAAAKIQYDPKSSNQIMRNLTDVFARDHFADYKGLSDTISISPEWAALLNVAGITDASVTDETSNATMMEALIQEFVGSFINPIYSPYLAKGEYFSRFVPAFPTQVLAATIGAVVAEGLSRQAYNWIVPYAVRGQGPNNTVVTALLPRKGLKSSKEDVLNMSLAAFNAKLDGSTTRIDYTIKRYGYGYGYQGSSTVAFGLTVLLIHAAVATAFILHSIYHRITGTGFTSSAWGGMGEMLALALHSGRPTGLQNVGGGVKAKSTWRMRVRVRERKGENLELVVGPRDHDGAQPCLDKNYH